MKIILLKSKIHLATVTKSCLDYEGSISLDPILCKASNIHSFEKVDIYNYHNGERFSTYVIFGKKNEVCLNGAAARKVQVGDSLIIASYALFEKDEISKHKPKIVFVTKKNKIKSTK